MQTIYIYRERDGVVWYSIIYLHSVINKYIYINYSTNKSISARVHVCHVLPRREAIRQFSESQQHRSENPMVVGEKPGTYGPLK